MDIRLQIKYKPTNESHEKDDWGNEFNHWYFIFNNGYGASVICHRSKTGRILSYGDLNSPFELAVLKYDSCYIDLCYSTPITNNVIGYLTSLDVEKLLEQLEQLEKE